MRPEEKLLSAFPVSEDVPGEYFETVPREYPFYLVDGELLRWEGEMEDVYSAVLTCRDDGLLPLFLGRCPLLDEQTVMQAVQAASNAYDNGLGAWPTMPLSERVRHLEAFGERMRDVREDAVRLMTLEICKPRRQAEMEFDRTVDYISDTLDALREMERESGELRREQGILARVRRAPLGPVLCMGPYNFPFNEMFATLVPALVMGNTAVVKLPRLGKLLLTPIIEALRDCFPKGVVNVIMGETETVEPILRSGLIKVFAFIGSSRVANELRQLHPQPNRLRCIFGLDAKNQALVLESADMDQAAREVLVGSLGFSGQRCTAVKIVFVHESRADELVARLDEGIAGLKAGMPFDENVDITPMPQPGKVEYLNALVEDAVSKGARIVNKGGGTFCRTLFHPTLLYPVTPEMRIYHEEQFGPIVPVVPFAEERTPVDYQVQSNFGQQVSIFGQDPEQVGRYVDVMVNLVSRVNLNCKCQRGPDTLPFGGRKDSAEGTLSVRDALRSFSTRAVVAGRDSTTDKELFSSLDGTHFSAFLGGKADS